MSQKFIKEIKKLTKNNNFIKPGLKIVHTRHKGITKRLYLFGFNKPGIKPSHICPVLCIKQGSSHNCTSNCMSFDNDTQGKWKCRENVYPNADIKEISYWTRDGDNPEIYYGSTSEKTHPANLEQLNPDK